MRLWYLLGRYTSANKILDDSREVSLIVFQFFLLRAEAPALVTLYISPNAPLLQYFMMTTLFYCHFLRGPTRMAVVLLQSRLRFRTIFYWYVLRCLCDLPDFQLLLGFIQQYRDRMCTLTGTLSSALPLALGDSLWAKLKKMKDAQYEKSVEGLILWCLSMISNQFIEGQFDLNRCFIIVVMKTRHSPILFPLQNREG